ncbi:uncharacterized protein HMPREF1541_08674 [Cyphellophora europaea CBS 101466]|uniref:AB hydrolase-1 domain-containing protein n=1 Tax=Cyphellophora europaea (strain CBS 101466) TaxID=1220924 RepID=W2RIU5_CYPE1|nr:uncharacterized protein HMPREF1541_08674 [Cyphellophora europaea CBS 101466]ETN36397.1 hypothetical protein HMPREF1541_08674 [Cyphellophora europaea CBS 101466]
MVFTLLVAALVAAGCLDASPVPSKGYTCREFTVSLPVDNVTTIVPFLPEIESAEQATYYADVLTTRQDSDSPAPPVEFSSITKTFSIVGDYCTPSNPGPKASTVHLLTHGLGFDRSYWDFYLPSNASDTQYSYIHAATAAGYSTISWNRLGIEPSTIGNPYTEIQTTVELALLAGLTSLVRRGGPAITGLAGPPDKVIHVGHSWGSILSKALVVHEPSLVDGVVLTGYTDIQVGQSLFLASTGFHLANANQPSRFPPTEYSNGFLTWPTQYANQFAFLAYPNFDPLVLAQAERTKYPFALGEFLSGAAIAGNATEFEGPVYYVASELDTIFCASNCTGLVGEDVPATREAFPGADLKVDIIEGAGHGLNLHYGADRAYAKIMEWVAEKF